MLARQSNELITLAALGNLEAVLVGPLLDLAVAPALQQSVAQGSLSRSSRLGGRGVLGSSAIGGELSVTADASNEFVASAGLRGGDAALVEPCLEVRVRPGLVEPVAGIAGSLADFVGNGLVVCACSVQKGVASARRRVRDAVVVEESLQLRLGPTGKVSR